MKTYQNQLSTIKPNDIEITIDKVFVYTNIEEKINFNNETELFNGYTFDFIEYTKDEYIQKQAESTITLEKELINTQLALCELYERITNG